MKAPKSQYHQVVIIGAGCSGLAAIKACQDAGITDMICFEGEEALGGNWRYTGDVRHSSVCETTFLISSKTLSSFSDFPMPEEYPDYPSHRQVLSYFQSYADHFGLEKYILYNTKVKSAKLQDDNSWVITTKDGQEHQTDYLMVANGHHSVPSHPSWVEKFTGQYLHSHAFKNNSQFKDKRVLVVGVGNSGCDCASEISRVASQVDISIRTPKYIIPKFFMGKPVDVTAKDIEKVPKFLHNPIQKVISRLMIGKYEDYGLPTPNHSITEDHPTLNSELLYKIRHGAIQPRPAIDNVEGKKVLFADGYEAEYDVLLAATGYKLSLPFFEKDFINYEDADRVPLYLRVFHPKYSSLFFIGLIQPQGAIWPASEMHAKLAVQQILGNWKRPANIENLAEKDADLIEKNFLKRKRHTIEVEFSDHIKKLKREHKNVIG